MTGRWSGAVFGIVLLSATSAWSQQAPDSRPVVSFTLDDGQRWTDGVDKFSALLTKFLARHLRFQRDPGAPNLTLKFDGPIGGSATVTATAIISTSTQGRGWSNSWSTDVGADGLQAAFSRAAELAVRNVYYDLTNAPKQPGQTSLDALFAARSVFASTPRRIDDHSSVWIYSPSRIDELRCCSTSVPFTGTIERPLIGGLVSFRILSFTRDLLGKFDDAAGRIVDEDFAAISKELAMRTAAAPQHVVACTYAVSAKERIDVWFWLATPKAADRERLRARLRNHPIAMIRSQVGDDVCPILLSDARASR